jgi:hypothetical protein
MNTTIGIKSEAFIVKVSGVKYQTPVKIKRGKYKRKNKKIISKLEINSTNDGSETETDEELFNKKDINSQKTEVFSLDVIDNSDIVEDQRSLLKNSLVLSKYPLNKKDITLSSYISITPVPYYEDLILEYETVEEKINELMNSFVEKNGDPKKDKHFWIRRANIFRYDGWLWRTTKEGIVFKFYRKGCTVDLNQKPLFIGLLLDAKCIGKTYQNIGRYEGEFVFAKECFKDNDKLQKWIEKIGLLTN